MVPPVTQSLPAHPPAGAGSAVSHPDGGNSQAQEGSTQPEQNSAPSVVSPPPVHSTTAKEKPAETTKPKHTEQAKPKPVEQTQSKPVEKTKPVEQAKPVEKTRPAEQAARTEEAAPAEQTERDATLGTGVCCPVGRAEERQQGQRDCREAAPVALPGLYGAVNAGAGTNHPHLCGTGCV